jgi:flagellar biosynthesis protein FlhG
MSIIISIGSGKGGTGKSTIAANLACVLARSGRRVCLADLDLGGADTHIQFGLFEPPRTLTDFITRRCDTLSEVLLTLDSVHGLQLLVGTGDTLQTANMNYQQKQRLLRALQTIDCDILLLDTGAGANYHVLDFFMAADIQVCTACPEATAIMDFYRFLQLATIRKALSSFLSGSEVGTALREHSFETLDQVFALAEKTQPGARHKAREALEFFNPLLIINRVGTNARLNQMKLRTLVAKYLGVNLPDLGEIPDDPAVSQALRHFLPVCEYAPDSPSARAITKIGTRLGKVVDLYGAKRRAAASTPAESESD